jgi:hypothetical protein
VLQSVLRAPAAMASRGPKPNDDTHRESDSVPRAPGAPRTTRAATTAPSKRYDGRRLCPLPSELPRATRRSRFVPPRGVGSLSSQGSCAACDRRRRCRRAAGRGSESRFTKEAGHNDSPGSATRHRTSRTEDAAPKGPLADRTALAFQLRGARAGVLVRAWVSWPKNGQR